MTSSTALDKYCTPTIANQSVTDLADRFGTPLYVYDSSVIEQRCAELSMFDTIRYAQKANSNLAILRIFRRLGVCLDAVSYGELVRAEQAGFSFDGDPPPVVYTADVMTPAALDYVGRHRVPVNCGSVDMIRQLGRAGTHSSIIVRVNPGFGHGHHQKTNTGGLNSKHGIWHERLGEAVDVARDVGLAIHGVHIHLGSGAEPAELQPATDAMERFAQQVGPTITMISAGGGIAVPYRESDSRSDLQIYGSCWRAAQERISHQFGHAVRLEVEPGRYLVAESGFLVAEILSVQIVGDRRFYLVDAGFNALARPVLYGAYHPITACPREMRRSTSVGPAVVGGPLCESGDIFTQREGGYVETRLLPELTTGDLIVIGVAGAYGMSMASNYNSYPRPAEVLIEGGTPRLIRRRESIDDLLQCESDV